MQCNANQHTRIIFSNGKNGIDPRPENLAALRESVPKALEKFNLLGYRDVLSGKLKNNDSVIHVCFSTEQAAEEVKNCKKNIPIFLGEDRYFLCKTSAQKVPAASLDHASHTRIISSNGQNGIDLTSENLAALRDMVPKALQKKNLPPPLADAREL
ncbi:hypothetical protein HDU88_006496 [Geranomyces variabilis]|nr:hypothetical protein HDU88_006496 [Geranomyces variabilis]